MTGQVNTTQPKLHMQQPNKKPEGVNQYSRNEHPTRDTQKQGGGVGSIPAGQSKLNQTLTNAKSNPNNPMQ